MYESKIILDPTAELEPAQRERLARPFATEGLTVGLLDISKARGNIFLDQLEARLQAQGMNTHRYAKPTFARVAPTELKQKIVTECDVVVEALADWGSCTSCSVHDISDLERRGIPGMFVASTEFIEAAEAQSAALGFEPAVVFVPHPIQDRTDDEIRIIADQAFESILNSIVKER